STMISGLPPTRPSTTEEIRGSVSAGSAVVRHPCVSLLNTKGERHDDPALPVLRWPHRRSAGLLQDGGWRRGGDDDAVQGQPRAAEGRLRAAGWLREQGDAFVIQDRQHGRDGVGWPLRG